MNPEPILSPEIRDIFTRWSASGKAVAASLRPNALRAKVLEAADTLYVLGQHGGEESAGKDVTAVLLDPTVTYSRIVLLADILGQLPATAPSDFDLSEAGTVHAWVRLQRLRHGDFELAKDTFQAASVGL